MQERPFFQFLFQPYNTKSFFVFFSIALLLLALCISIFVDPGDLNSNDLMLVAWEPGRELLQTGSVYADYPYPIWTVVVMLPITFWERQTSMLIWLICNLLMLAASLALLLKILDWKVTPALMVLTISFAGLYLPVLTSVGLGQMTILSLFTLTLMVYFFLTERWTWLGIMIGMSFIKPQIMLLLTGLLLLWVLIHRRWQALIGFGMVILFFVAISLPFISSPQQIIGGGISSHFKEYLLRTSNIWSLLMVLELSWFVSLGICIALVGWLGWLWLSSLKSGATSSNRFIFLFSAAVIINLIIIPYSWMYNLVLLLLPFGYTLSQALKLKGNSSLLWQVLIFAILQPLTIAIFIIFKGYSGTQAHQIIPAIALLLTMTYLEHQIDPTVA